jgi:hypothetical protein
LAEEIFSVLGTSACKIVAQMNRAEGATHFQAPRLSPGSAPQDFVIDRAGHTRDRVVMSYDVQGLTDRVD